MSPRRVALLSAKPEHCPRRPCRFHYLVPDGAVYVGRQAPGLKRSPYANPYPLSRFTLVESRDLFRANALPTFHLWPLRGFNLVCPSCPLDAEWCHADDLLAEANR